MLDVIPSENRRIHDAIRYAADMHLYQVRKGTSLPYILHPLETMTVLRAMHADPNLLMAGVLHDTVEDTAATHEELLKRFGSDVADLVNAHTEDKSLPWQARKQHTIDTIAAGDRRLRMLILADKVSNLRSIAADLRRPDNNVWSRFKCPKEDQRWYYCSSLEAVRDLEGDPDIGPVCREMAELCREVFGAD